MDNDISILANDISYYKSLVLFPYNENVSYLITKFDTNLQSIQTNLGLSMIIDDSIYTRYKFSINVSDNSIIKNVNILSVFITYNDTKAVYGVESILFFCKWGPTLISNSIQFEAHSLDMRDYLIVSNININIIYQHKNG